MDMQSIKDGFNINKIKNYAVKGYKMKKDNERLKGFLKDDLLKIQINLSEIKDQLNKYNYNSKEREFENIENILSYWFNIYKKL